MRPAVVATPSTHQRADALRPNQSNRMVATGSSTAESPKLVKAVTTGIGSATRLLSASIGAAPAPLGQHVADDAKSRRASPDPVTRLRRSAESREEPDVLGVPRPIEVEYEPARGRVLDGVPYQQAGGPVASIRRASGHQIVLGARVPHRKYAGFGNSSGVHRGQQSPGSTLQALLHQVSDDAKIVVASHAPFP